MRVASSGAPGRPAGVALRVALCAAISLPAIFCRLAGVHLGPLAAIALNGAAVVSAAFLLAWAAEAAQKDISGNLALALLALIAVLPEYAIDLYFGWSAGHSPQAAHYAAANMTGSNRLLLGFGWPFVLFLYAWGRKRRLTGSADPVQLTKVTDPVKSVQLTDSSNSVNPAARGPLEIILSGSRRIELAALGLASLWCLFIPWRGSIGLADAAVLLALFLAYLWRAAKEEHQEPELVGVAAALGEMPAGRRRALVIGFFLFAAAAILCAAQPFADALVGGGKALGLDEFLLVQWLAPLASEAPEFLVAAILAARGDGDAALGALLSSKVNQWTLLVGSLPIANKVGGGAGALLLDARQFEELLLTATQALLGFAVLCDLRLKLWEAVLLLGLFASQLCFTQTGVRLWFSGAYALAALGILLLKLGDLKQIALSAKPGASR